MNKIIYNVSLDMNSNTSQALLNIKKEDNGRRILLTLTDGGKPYTISNDCTAVLRARKPDGTILFNNCTISNNTITYELTNQTSSSPGVVECELTLYGADSKQITSPRFALRVDGTLYSDDEVESTDEFTELRESIEECDNLDVSVSKSGLVATITVTKKDGTTETAVVNDGDDHIFVAVYGETSCNDIIAAADDGMAVYAIKDGKTFSYDGSSSGTAYFSSLGRGNSQTKNVISVNNANVWSEKFYNLIGISASPSSYDSGTMLALKRTSSSSNMFDLVELYEGICFTAKQKNSTIKLTQRGGATAWKLKISYDNKSWSDYTNDSVITLENVGDKAWFAGTDENKKTVQNVTDYNYFVMTGKLECSGNVMRLISQFDDKLLNRYQFCGLFSGCESLLTAPKLPAKTLTVGCYRYMFGGCTSLISAPELLASKLLTESYYSMFFGCTSLKTVEIMATVYDSYSCAFMFNGCTSINNIKIHYIGGLVVSSTSNWVRGVGTTGYFYYNGTDTRTGISAIPSGWTVHTFED